MSPLYWPPGCSQITASSFFLRAFALTVPLAWNAFPGNHVTCSLTEFSSLLKCHPIKRPFLSALCRITPSLCAPYTPCCFYQIFFFFFFRSFFFFYFLFLYLFLAVLGLRFCARAFSSCGKWGPLFIAVRRPLTIAASLVAKHRLQTRRLSSCGSRTQSLHGMWDLPRPGLGPVSPALAGRFSTTAPPGKPQIFFFFIALIPTGMIHLIRCLLTVFLSRM